MGNYTKTVALIVVSVFVVAGLTVFVGSARASVPHNGVAKINPVMLRDLTLDPTSFPAADFHDIQASPPPPVPPTTPIVVNITQYGVVHIPVGQWETVIMNFSGYDAGTAYDYFNNVYINNASVLISTQPEAGSWGVMVNLSEFMSFFDGQSTIYFQGPFTPGLHPNFEGIQYNNMSLLFYPIPQGWTAPPEPNIVEPLHISGNNNLGVAPISIPSDASAVELQTVLISSEFWYADEPAYSAESVWANGYRLTTLFAQPWINSGGIDLFAWRPIYPVGMLDHYWTYTNLTPALGILEQSSNLTFAGPQGYAEGGAGVNGNLLIWTNPNVTGAQQLTYSSSVGPLVTAALNNTAVINSDGNYFTTIDQSKQVSYSYSSEIMTTTGDYTSSISTMESWFNDQNLNPIWENVSQNQIVSSTQTTVYNETGMHGTSTVVYSQQWPLFMDLGAQLTFLYQQLDNATNVPPFYNQFYTYTSYFLNAQQGLIQSTMTSSDINGMSSQSFSYFSDQIYGTNGVFSSILEISPYYAIILNITSSFHVTHKAFLTYNWQSTGGSFSGSFFEHLLSGAENNSTSYYVQETVTQNQVIQGTF